KHAKAAKRGSTAKHAKQAKNAGRPQRRRGTRRFLGRPLPRLLYGCRAEAHTRYLSEGRALACFAVILSGAALKGIVVTVTESDRIAEQVDRAADEIVQYT